MNTGAEKILEALRSCQGDWISGEVLCQELGVSRTAIWKQIHSLQQQGYDIRAKRHLGYRFVAGPGIPLENEVTRLLETERIGQQFFFSQGIDSTNLWAMRQGLEGVEEGAVFVAESQTEGRGRHGAPWFSPPGRNLYVSLLLRPHCDISALPELISLGAEALLATVIAEQPKLELKIQSPGDLFWHDRKLAGFLCEMVGESEEIRFAVLGLGMLVNVHDAELPIAWRGKMTSLAEAVGSDCDRPRLLASFFNQFECRYNKWKMETESR